MEVRFSLQQNGIFGPLFDSIWGENFDIAGTAVTNRNWAVLQLK